jgi:Universal stress protein family
MEARIREKQEVAKGTLMVTFDLLGNEVDFRPGQYFYVTLPDVGYQDEKGLRRHIKDGAPELTLIDASTDAGLMVVGSSGRGHPRMMISGSTAFAVVHGAQCPVAVV